MIFVLGYTRTFLFTKDIFFIHYDLFPDDSGSGQLVQVRADKSERWIFRTIMNSFY